MTPSPLIAISQRVDALPSRAETRDALDQAWIGFFQAAGARLLLLPNGLADPVAYVRDFKIDGLVLSGGNDLGRGFPTRSGAPAQVTERPDMDVQPARDGLEAALLAASLDQGWPVLGVCRGMQAINLFHGGRLVPVAGHRRTRHPLVAAPHQSWIGSVGSVNSYHDFGVPVPGVAPGFQLLAAHEDVAEAIWHPQHRHLGIMWHPEREAPFAPSDLHLFRTLFEIAS